MGHFGKLHSTLVSVIFMPERPQCNSKLVFQQGAGASPSMTLEDVARCFDTARVSLSSEARFRNRFRRIICFQTRYPTFPEEWKVMNFSVLPAVHVGRVISRVSSSFVLGELFGWQLNFQDEKGEQDGQTT